MARELIPLLKDVRQSIGSRPTIEPGTLPPSPITGRNSTLIAFRVFGRSIEVAPSVVEAMDRLLRWNQQLPLKPADRALVEEWVQNLRVKVLGRLAARGKGIGCDDACLIGHLTRPAALFGSTRHEREEARDDLLLTALADAVKSAEEWR
jgi:hypothetical protein